MPGRKKLFTCLFVLSAFLGAAQISSDMVEELGVEIKEREEGNDSIYAALKKYDAVLLGEMHGTQEAPEFIVGIVRSLMKNGRKVVVALELPPDGLDPGKNFTLETLKEMPAFSGTSPDGRQSVAWAEMLIELQKMKAEIMCYDLAMHHKMDKQISRDSVMFAHINDYLKTDTTKMLVSLSGNISNMIGKYNGAKTMAYYLANHKESCLKGKEILSLNHVYGKGTMHNWMNDGYKLRETEGNGPFYEFASSWDNYLFAYPDPFMKGYGGVIFSRTLTASGPLVKKQD